MKDWRISCIRRTSKHPGLVLLALAALAVSGAIIQAEIGRAHV